MFIDASAVVGILNEEADKDELLFRLETAATRATTSPFALLESVVVLAARLDVSIKTAQHIVQSFLELLKVQVVPVTVETGRGALAAFARYGKGPGHPARLNLGDCLAYAGAKELDLPLHYKGNDFIHTDLA